MTNVSNWTIMVYISADDVLANFAIDSLNQFRQAASNDGDIVMALFDPNDGSEEAFRYRFDGKNKDESTQRVLEKERPCQHGGSKDFN